MAQIIDLNEYRMRRDVEARLAETRRNGVPVMDITTLTRDIQEVLKELGATGLRVEIVDNPEVGAMLADLREQGVMTLVDDGDQGMRPPSVAN